MSGSDLDELQERAQRWRELAKDFTDKQAVEALTAAVEQIERKIACLKTDRDLPTPQEGGPSPDL
jgi:predicted  nucleic acid-binding Zn-ribbon protein